MLNILLKPIDKQINYKVTSDIAISHTDEVIPVITDEG